MSPSQAERTAATRARLVAAGARLFAERGFAEVPAEEIGRAAGVTRGALYHHFADKTDLLRAVHEHLEEHLVATIAERVAEVADPWEALVIGLDGYLDACEDPALARITLIEAPSVLGWARWREIDGRYGLGLMRAVLGGAMQAGTLRRQPVDPLAQLLIAAMGEAGLLLAEGRATRGQVRSSLLTLLEGLRS